MLTERAPTERLSVATVEEVRWGAATDRGPRRINADATASHRDPRTGRLAFALADGIGDEETAAACARRAAQVAANAAAAAGDPVAGVLAAQRAVLAAPTDGDCVLVVALPWSGPAGRTCAVAWVGDCRAYAHHGRVLEQITADHTVAEYFRSRRQPVTPRMEHLVTTSVRTAAADQVGVTRTSLGGGRLVLCSDGVHRALPLVRLRAALDDLDRAGDPDATVAALVALARRAGSTDNATALLVDNRPTGATSGRPRPALAA